MARFVGRPFHILLGFCNVIAGLCVMDVDVDVGGARAVPARRLRLALHPTCSRPETTLLHARFYLILCIASFFEMLSEGLAGV